MKGEEITEPVLEVEAALLFVPCRRHLQETRLEVGNSLGPFASLILLPLGFSAAFSASHIGPLCDRFLTEKLLEVSDGDSGLLHLLLAIIKSRQVREAFVLLHDTAEECADEGGASGPLGGQLVEQLLGRTALVLPVQAGNVLRADPASDEK